MAINNSYFVMPLNMDRVCRICLQENTNLSPIFSNGQNIGNLADLPQKIQICGGVECQEQDGFPALICDVCIYKASIAYEFRQLCQHSDTRLRLYNNKPPKYNAIDSGTQTDLQTQALLTKTTEELQNNYYVKTEVINNQHFHTTLSNETYNPEPQASAVVTSIESSIPTNDVNITVTGEKLFNCHVSFDDQSKVISKNSEDISCDTQSVTCAQELIPVASNLIDSVCNIETDINAENDIKDDVSYFTYMTKDQTLEENNDQSKDTLLSQSKDIPNNNFNEEKIENNYFEVDNDSQSLEASKFKCEICSKLYNTLQGLKKHKLMHEKSYKCEICFKTFCKLENLEKHKNIHATKPYACQSCHASFSKAYNLTKHLKSHDEKSNNFEQTSLNDQKCEKEMKKKFKNRDDTEDENESGNEHKHEHEPDGFENTPEIFVCEECGQYCSTLKSLKRHSLIHGEKKYSCTVCKKWFFRPDTLKKHAEKHGHGLLDNISDNNKLYESDDDMLQKNTKSNIVENNLRKDESGNESNGEYKCQQCDKVMSSEKSLRRHTAIHKPKPEPAVCEICKKVCASRARLTLHQKTHSKPKEKVLKQYLCHICSKVYPSNSSLTYHMRTHTGVKPHVCKTCNSGFTTTTSLANHIRIHTGDKPFVCHVCSAAFAVSSAFRRHLTRHTGEANYLCKTCGKAFKRLSTLKEHTYTHSGEKPYVCKNCGAAYSHSGSLFAHQKRCRAQCTEMAVDDHQHSMAHHVHVNNMQSAVRSLAVIGQIF